MNRAVSKLVIVGAVGAALGCSQSSSSPTSQSTILLGTYEAATSGTIDTITFTDPTHYWLRTADLPDDAPISICTGTHADPCLETGTYVFSPAQKSLSLTDDASGQTTTLAFELQDAATLQTQSLPLGGSGLKGDGISLLGDGGALTSGTVTCLYNHASGLIANAFRWGTQLFHLHKPISAPPEWDRNTTRPTGDDATVQAQQRSASQGGCQFSRGAMPSETLGADIPVTQTICPNGEPDDNIPIQNIVVLMQENRAFDSYYGHLNQYRANNGYPTSSDPNSPYYVESAPGTATNPDANGVAHPWQHALPFTPGGPARLCIPSTNHEWFGAHNEYDNGAMDGFYKANNGYTDDCKTGPYPCAMPAHMLPPDPYTGGSLLDGSRALFWYDERDIPFYYAMASTFGLADHYHSAILGPTWPNRDYLYAATSMGQTTNLRPDLSQKGFPAYDAVIFDELEKRHVSWAIYAAGLVPGVETFLPPLSIRRWKLSGALQIHYRVVGDPTIPGYQVTDFFRQAREGKLPQVSFVDPLLAFENDHNNNDEHPPGDIQRGQAFVAAVVHALMSSPQWPHIAFFLAYDEHGGIYDHVAPPPACAPDNIAPNLVYPLDQAVPADGFAHYGVRVPFIVVSPYVKKNYVSHHLYDHTSILRFIEAKFKIPALTARDANADALFDFFDFKNPPYMTPPTLPNAVVEADRHAACDAIFVNAVP